MNTTLVPIPTNQITDWPSFHKLFAHVLGFPAYYGMNMDAWIDCMTYADEPEAQMLAKGVPPGELLTLQINDAADFAVRCPEQFKALVECTAFVNYRRVEIGGTPVLCLLMSGVFS
ncbi:MAG: barstar family protein [Alphaproteobacteria bacterium]|nr:barstar family protein [Alphaproteobacteria bacterium]MBU2380391.1 barstar family protein [Alphaproteobacteria bacterium]